MRQRNGLLLHYYFGTPKHVVEFILSATVTMVRYCCTRQRESPLEHSMGAGDTPLRVTKRLSSVYQGGVSFYPSYWGQWHYSTDTIGSKIKDGNNIDTILMYAKKLQNLHTHC